jgi:hypothetical protein
MSEKELGRALLELDSQKLAGVPDAREQTWKVLERDRRRVWWWTALTIGLWAAALGMVLLMLVHYALIFPLQAKLAGETDDAQLAQQREPGRIQLDKLTPEELEKAKFKAQILFQMATVGVTFSVGLTCMAVLASVLLNRASRQATLRQINASLLEISNQLKELRQITTPPSKSL